MAGCFKEGLWPIFVSGATQGLIKKQSKQSLIQAVQT
jgi:hypothetical protein